MNVEQLVSRLAAIASPQRMRIIAELSANQLHVSALARRLEMSRALLYMHLTKLEEAGFVAGHLELSSDGKALKFFKVVPFSIVLDQETLVKAIEAAEGPSAASTFDTEMKGKR